MVTNVKVTITRYLSDEPQPGIVECQLSDAHGHVWTFIEKTAIPWCSEELLSETHYPQYGAFACTVLERTRNASGREIILIDTSKPDAVETVDGCSQFEVCADSLVADQNAISA